MLLDQLLRKVEAPSYDTLFRHAQQAGGQFAGTRPTQMTIQQALEFQNPSGAYGKYVASTRPDPEVGVATPMGRYQIVGTTLRNAVQQMNLDPNTPFNAETQDQIGKHLIDQRLSRANTIEGKRQQLRQEFQGFQNVDNATLDRAIMEYEQAGRPALSPLTGGAGDTTLTGGTGGSKQGDELRQLGKIALSFGAEADKGQTAILQEAEAMEKNMAQFFAPHLYSGKNLDMGKAVDQPAQSRPNLSFNLPEGGSDGPTSDQPTPTVSSSTGGALAGEVTEEDTAPTEEEIAANKNRRMGLIGDILQGVGVGLTQYGGGGEINTVPTFNALRSQRMEAAKFAAEQERQPMLDAMEQRKLRVQERNMQIAEANTRLAEIKFNAEQNPDLSVDPDYAAQVTQQFPQLGPLYNQLFQASADGNKALFDKTQEQITNTLGDIAGQSPQVTVDPETFSAYQNGDQRTRQRIVGSLNPEQLEDLAARTALGGAGVDAEQIIDVPGLGQIPLSEVPSNILENMAIDGMSEEDRNTYFDRKNRVLNEFDAHRMRAEETAAREREQRELNDLNSIRATVLQEVDQSARDEPNMRRAADAITNYNVEVTTNPGSQTAANVLSLAADTVGDAPATFLMRSFFNNLSADRKTEVGQVFTQMSEEGKRLLFHTAKDMGMLNVGFTDREANRLLDTLPNLGRSASSNRSFVAEMAAISAVRKASGDVWLSAGTASLPALRKAQQSATSINNATAELSKWYTGEQISKEYQIAEDAVRTGNSAMGGTMQPREDAVGGLLGGALSVLDGSDGPQKARVLGEGAASQAEKNLVRGHEERSAAIWYAGGNSETRSQIIDVLMEEGDPYGGKFDTRKQAENYMIAAMRSYLPVLSEQQANAFFEHTPGLTLYLDAATMQPRRINP